jgi:protein-disulfide isomerase
MEEENTSNSHSQHNHAPQMNMGIPLFLGFVVAGALIAGAILYTGGAFTKGMQPGGTPNVPGDAQQAGSTVEGANQIEKRINLAGTVGLDKEKFKACIEKSDKTEVTKDVDDLTKAFVEYNKTLPDPRDGLGGTPTFIVGKVVDGNMVEGQAIVGALPFETFDEFLDSWSKGNKKVMPGYTQDKLIKVSLDDDPVYGNKDSQIIMVEVSDYECPFCQRYYNDAYQQIKEKYIDAGKIKLVFRDFPIPGHNPVATDAHVAANCAKEQGGDEAYFKFHDAYFAATQSNGRGL